MDAYRNTIVTKMPSIGEPRIVALAGENIPPERPPTALWSALKTRDCGFCVVGNPATPRLASSSKHSRNSARRSSSISLISFERWYETAETCVRVHKNLRLANYGRLLNSVPICCVAGFARIRTTTGRSLATPATEKGKLLYLVTKSFTQISRSRTISRGQGTLKEG